VTPSPSKRGGRPRPSARSTRWPSSQEALGSLDRIERVLTVTGFVSSAPDFHEQPAVVDGASKVLADVFGEAGRHTRSAIGVAALPRNGAVEIEVTVALRS
jgi:enamine deaminase RidA (YjgF/YER057c/UK114 family)